MYGTRSAAQGWQHEYSETMLKMGFTQGLSSPCVFYHHTRELVCNVHGDDFTTAGSKKNLDWFENTLEKVYELTKGGRIGSGANDAKEGRILNRVVRWTAAGLEYEADPRQVERLLEQTGLEGANSVSTPGVKPLPEQLAADKLLPESEVTGFRAKAARANYLAADRPDIQFAAKEACRWMSQPTELSMAGVRSHVQIPSGSEKVSVLLPFPGGQ